MGSGACRSLGQLTVQQSITGWDKGTRGTWLRATFPEDPESAGSLETLTHPTPVLLRQSSLGPRQGCARKGGGAHLGHLPGNIEHASLRTYPLETLVPREPLSLALSVPGVMGAGSRHPARNSV